MKAVVVPKYGSSEVLQVQNISKPTPKDNEVLVKVHSSALTTADAMMRSGTPKFARLFLGVRRPSKKVIGTGFADIIESLGKNVKNYNVGDEVFGETGLNFGANAEYARVDAQGVIMIKPDFISFEEASVLCDGVLTSYSFLQNIGQLKEGQSVLINGASGSLGIAAIQIAKALGAFEIVGVCSTKNVGFVKSLGATQVVDYRQEDFTKLSQQFDLVFDTIGKSTFKACKPILKENGSYMTPVLNFTILWQMLTTKKGKGKSAQFSATGMLLPSQLKEMVKEVLNLYHQGKISIPIEKEYSIEQIREAHAHIDSGRKRGNIVMKMHKAITEKVTKESNLATSSI